MGEEQYSNQEITTLFRLVRDVEKNVKDEFQKLQSKGNLENIPVVVLVGPTGSGKTTLYHALTGKPLKGRRANSERILEAVNPDENFKIGITGLSETSNPGIIFDEKNGLIICDCPGFFDNRSEIQDICNSFAIYQVLSQSQNVKILMLTSKSDINATRSISLRQSCEMIEKMIPKREELQPSVGLVITRFDPEDLIPDNEGDKVSFLDNVDSGGGWLVNHFRNNEHNKNRVVFKFPYPKVENFNDPLKNFEDKDEVLKFIRKKNSAKITPFVALDNKAKLMILRNANIFGDLRIFISLLVDRIRIDIAESDDSFQMWKERIDRLNECKFSTPEDFVNKARDIINPSPNLYESIYEGMLKINEWRNFLDKIVVDDIKYKDEIINRDSPLLSSVYLDITEYFGKLLSPVITILNSKIDKSNIEKKRDELLEELKQQTEKNLKLEKERSEERLQLMQREEEMKREVASFKEQYLSCQRQLEETRSQLMMLQSQSGGGGGGGFLNSLVSGAIGGYLISLL